jgi:protein O-GlcNAc transferase
LKSPLFGDLDLASEVRQRFGAHGIAVERVELRGRDPTLNAHLRSYHDVDIALDTFPYHGTTTTCDALWMGVPVVTWRGDRHAARVGASLLHRVGLDDLVATSAEQYVAKAAALAVDRARLQALRAHLRPAMQASPLMDGRRIARAMEESCREMVATLS